MKLILTTALAATLATSAFAGKSDRYNDIRLDTAVGHVNSFADTPRAKAKNVQTVTRSAKPRVSTRNAGRNLSRTSTPQGYAYANPYGVGPHNDSR